MKIYLEHRGYGRSMGNMIEILSGDYEASIKTIQSLREDSNLNHGHPRYITYEIFSKAKIAIDKFAKHKNEFTQLKIKLPCKKTVIYRTNKKDETHMYEAVSESSVIEACNLHGDKIY